jgi:DNA-binding XRE family transcriptional regulator
MHFKYTECTGSAAGAHPAENARMAGNAKQSSEFARRVGLHLARARQQAGRNQAELAQLCGLTRFVVMRIEAGVRSPTLEEAVQFAHHLNLPLQMLLSGGQTPGDTLQDLAIELRTLGITDLLVEGAVVPGAFRPQEEVLVLAVAGDQPDTRVVEAMPYVLATAPPFALDLLRAYARQHDRRALHRLAWLSDVAEMVHDDSKLLDPGRRRLLERLRKSTRPPETPDDLGRPALNEPLLPVSRRWNITYAATLATFRSRADSLARAADPNP